METLSDGRAWRQCAVEDLKEEKEKKEERISSFRPRVCLGSSTSLHLSAPLSMLVVIPLRKPPAVQPVE